MSQSRPSYSNCDEVTPECPVEFTIYGDYLNVGSNAFFAVAYALCLIVIIFLGVRGRMWSFTIWLGIGVAFEVIGYVARIREHYDPWSSNTFIAEYATLLLAPTLIAAAVSITFKHLVLYYGPKWSVFRPSLYPWVFVGTDFLSIFIQVIGAGATAVATTGDASQTVADLGEGLVIGGVAFQVANMIVCSALMLIYIKRRKNALRSGGRVTVNNQSSQDSFLQNQGYNGGYASQGQQQQQPPAYGGHGYAQPPAQAQPPMQFEKGNASFQTETKRAKWFVYSLMVAYPAIIIRCAYRLVLLSLPLSLSLSLSPLFNN